MIVSTMEHRTSKIIGFKAFFERDDDILDWWENIPSGERSHVLRSLIRAYLTGEVIVTPYGEEAVAFSSSVQLARVQSDTTQIRDAVLEIPTYIEQIISQKMRGVQAAPAIQETLPTATASEDDAEKRIQRMQKKSW
ncbi:MAG: hypothetical protein F9K28_07590 [Bacteroidetes bacterium]|nr:MAG: hypothetical protein F9K28_07590 [Bacteroidota bacterium]